MDLALGRLIGRAVDYKTEYASSNVWSIPGDNQKMKERENIASRIGVMGNLKLGWRAPTAERRTKDPRDQRRILQNGQMEGEGAAESGGKAR